MSDSTMTSRRRPLFTLGASILAMAHNFCRKSVELKGPIGSVTRRIAKVGSVASPLAYWIQYQWLVILSYVDDHILSMEKFVEAHCPPSRHVFDKIDSMIDKVENLPRKFDDKLDKVPVVLHKVPFLDWAVINAIKWLNFVTNALMIWGLHHNTKEKEITVDKNCEEKKNQNEVSSSLSSSTHTKTASDSSTLNVLVPNLKCSYKDALEKGVNSQHTEEDSHKGGKVVEENGAKDDTEEEAWEGDDDIFEGTKSGHVLWTEEDPLLDLFEFGWQTPKSRFIMERSASYT